MTAIMGPFAAVDKKGVRAAMSPELSGFHVGWGN
jgi:hypothetical protein